MRATECRSPYSDMSRRTSAFSSSKRNSASARASSVFPTPVGPRKRKEPRGRFSGARPARARRTASATARLASSCPMTRCPSRSSMWSSFSISVSSIRVTGIPVQRETTSAMSSASTSSLSMRRSFWWAASAPSASSICRRAAGISP